VDVWHRAEIAEPPADPTGYDAVMTFGGSVHAHQEDDHPWLVEEKAMLAELLAAGTPLLGVCLGCQLLTEAAGGTTRRSREPEIGWYAVELTEAGEDDPVLGPLAPGFEAFQWHSNECLPPAGVEILATSPVCGQAFRFGEVAWGIQFHAEVAATDAASWIANYTNDPDAIRMGVDPDVLGPETARRAPHWSELGRELCRRFLAAAESRYSPVSGVR
jgi:GMP synthase-like glutamine amidotransferase